MLPGASGLRWMPRKIAGIEMITIEASIVAIVMLSVVLDRAIHLYLSGCPSDARSSGCRLEVTPTFVQPTVERLLDHNYLPARPPTSQRAGQALHKRVQLNPRDTHDHNYSGQLVDYDSQSILL